MKREELVKIYRANVENGNWESVAKASGLTESTARQKIGMIRREQEEILMKAGKSEEEAKALVRKAIPFFKRETGPRLSKQNEVDAVTQLVLELAEADMSAEA